MENCFLTADKARLKAHEAYLADLKELSAMETRLVGQYNAKLNFSTPLGQKKAKSMLGEIDTIKAQIAKIHDSVKEARARRDAKLDSVNASVVEKFRGLASYGLSQGTANAGVRYLLGECQDFDKAAGNFELRAALYNSVTNIAAAIVSKDDAEETKGIPSDQLAVYETFNTMEDDQGKSTYFAKHKDVICGVYDLMTLK